MRPACHRLLHGTSRLEASVLRAFLLVWLVAASAGCLAGDGTSRGHPECDGLVAVFTAAAPDAWNRTFGPTSPALEGWPLKEGFAPAPGANLTRVLWRPDGRDPFA